MEGALWLTVAFPSLGGRALCFKMRKARRSPGHLKPLPSGNLQGQSQPTRRPMAGPRPEEQGDGSWSVCGQSQGCQVQQASDSQWQGWWAPWSPGNCLKTSTHRLADRPPWALRLRLCSCVPS